MRTRAKICGITRIEDIHSAVNAGVDAIGLVFYAPSPRSVTIQQAQELGKAYSCLCTNCRFIRECNS